MTQIHIITNRRYGLTTTFATVAAMSLITAACTTVPINPNDSSPPQVKIFLLADLVAGQIQERTSVKYSNDTAQQPLEILCSVYDPEGIKSADLRVSDTTVDAAYCGGTVYPGNYVVDGLPSPDQSTGWISPGTTKRQLYGYIEISGILQLATKPLGVTETCYPANNTTVTVRCQGRNWSSIAGASTTTKYLQVNFSF